MLGAGITPTAKAIAWLRANYTKPLRVEELAEIARMGMSTLHHHFRALTAMSPLQYQKQLRLFATGERMLAEGIDAASAAFEVGYESASQFNREHKRFLRSTADAGHQSASAHRLRNGQRLRIKDPETFASGSFPHQVQV
jgi:transcriptional regulator GlxA family with amidase domain